MAKFIEANDHAFKVAAQGFFKGAVKGVSNNDYHSLKEYWSSTQLKFMYDHAPAHFEERYLKPQDSGKQSKAKAMGSLVHCLTLTPNEFEKEFFIMPDLNLRTNDGKAMKEELLLKHAGKIAITDEQLAEAHLMRESIMRNPKARAILEPGLKEVSYFWECPFSQLKMRAKLDQSSSGHFTELKTTCEVGPENFARQVYNLHYDLSLFHYREAMKQTKTVEVDVPQAFFLVVESEAPYVTQVYKVSELLWTTGRDKWLTAVQRLEVALKTKEWGGYFPSDLEAPEIAPPPWATKKHEVV